MNRANSSGSNSVGTYTTDSTTTSTCNLLNTYCVSEKEEEKDR